MSGEFSGSRKKNPYYFFLGLAYIYICVCVCVCVCVCYHHQGTLLAWISLALSLL